MGNKASDLAFDDGFRAIYASGFGMVPPPNPQDGVIIERDENDRLWFWPEPIHLSEQPPKHGQFILFSTDHCEYKPCRYLSPGVMNYYGIEELVNESSVWLPMPPKPG